jgi:hypothetical protein
MKFEKAVLEISVPLHGEVYVFIHKVDLADVSEKGRVGDEHVVGFDGALEVSKRENSLIIAH